MKVLLVAPLTKQTGNTSSAQRIRDLIASDKSVLSCELVNCHDFDDTEDFRCYVEASHATCLLAIHAYRSGHLLTGVSIPYGIVFGGTDVNEHHKDQSRMEVMTAALGKSRYVVAFSKSMVEKAKVLWPDISDRLIHQPQGITTQPSVEFCFHEYLHRNHRVPMGSNIFLLVAGIRKVKDPMFIAKVFSDWHSHDETNWLVIVGPHLDIQYTHECKAAINRLSGILLIDSLPKTDIHAAIRDSTVLVNSSLSEGMSAAILEAMHLGTLVIARNIEGNAAIVHHRDTGLLFNTPPEFIEQAKDILSRPSYRDTLSSNARQYVTEHHSVKKERLCYLDLVKNLCTVQT